MLNIAYISLVVRFFSLVEMSDKAQGTACLDDPNRNIQTYKLSVYVPKICIVISVVPWRSPLGDFD